MVSFDWTRIFILFFIASGVVALQSENLLPLENRAVTPSKCPRRNPQVPDGTLIDKLWKKNCNTIVKFLENAFTAAQAAQTSQGTFESLQYYFVQDYYYLTLTIPQKAYLLKTDPDVSPAEKTNSINATVQDMNGDLEYADTFFLSLISPDHLDVPEDDIENTKLEPVLGEYVDWLEKNTELGRFLWNVSRVACIYGWAELANRLKLLNTTKTDSKFYHEWIVPNLDWSYGEKLSKELQEMLADNNNPMTLTIANRLFRKGFEFETRFFESAIGKTLDDLN